MDSALNNQRWLICHKTKPNFTKPGTKGFFSCFRRDMNIILPSAQYLICF